MMRVALVGTVHGERGGVTVSALLGILERLAPRALFAEIPASHIERYIDGSHGTLESRAVARYVQMRDVEVVPVDAPEPSREFFENDEHLFRQIEKTSPEHRRLLDLHFASVDTGGFEYLNSHECLSILEAVSREAADTVEWLRDPRLRALHEASARVMESRDSTILATILDYGDRTGHQDGLLLVGTAHRRALIEKAAALDPPKLTWDLTGFLARAL